MGGFGLATPEVVGAAMAVALWFAIGRNSRAAALLAGIVLCGAIAVARLEPFQFRAPAQVFGHSEASSADR
jgi:hypothetical protein